MYLGVEHHAEVLRELDVANELVLRPDNLHVGICNKIEISGQIKQIVKMEGLINKPNSAPRLCKIRPRNSARLSLESYTHSSGWHWSENIPNLWFSSSWIAFIRSSCPLSAARMYLMLRLLLIGVAQRPVVISLIVPEPAVAACLNGDNPPSLIVGVCLAWLCWKSTISIKWLKS